MKKLILLLLLIPIMGYGQEIYTPDYSLEDCGEWVKDKITESKWETTDTLNYNPKADDEWIESEWNTWNTKGITLAMYCPCGCGYDTQRTKNRINKRGIVQTKIETTTYRYIPKPKDDYESLYDSLYNENDKRLREFYSDRFTSDSIMLDYIQTDSIVVIDWSSIPTRYTFEATDKSSLPVVINDLLEYERECYNDSTISSLFFITSEGKGFTSGFTIDNREFLTWQDAEHSNYPNDNYLFTEENIWQWWVNKRNSSPYADYHISEKYIRCEKEYAHREPTFKGFLIWLKERNKL